MVTSPHRLIIGGDFNFHVEDNSNSEAKKFLDLLDSTNLKNNVWIGTHTSGHALDLLITRSSDSILLNDPQRRYFISDHAFIKVQTKILMPPIESKIISFRKVKDIDLDRFKDDNLHSELMDMGDLSVHDKALIYDRELKRILDDHAPVITKEIKVKKGSPWYNDELRALKRKKRQAENKWLKSQTVQDQIVFKELRQEYIKRCNLAKEVFYSKEVAKCKGDQKQLYKLISKLTEGDTTMPYPDSTSDNQLCEQFSDFFLEKNDKSMDEIVESENLNKIVNYTENQDSTIV